MVQLLKFGMLALMLAMVLPIVIGQEAKLEMKFVGYGNNYQEIHVSFKNTGEITISDVTVYIDGEAFKTIKGASAPGTTFVDVYFLEEGKHTIEARTPEGAYNSIEVTASEGEITETTTTIPEKPEEIKSRIFDWIKQNILWIILGVAVIVFVVSICLVGKERFVRK